MIFTRADPFGVWRQEAWELLDPAVKRAGEAWAHVDDMLAAGAAVLWLAITDAPVAAMVTAKAGDQMLVWFAGGAVLSGCVPFLGLVEAEAKTNGMKRGRLTGRKGWARVLRGLGWRVEGDDLVKEL